MRILVSPTSCLYRVADENALDALVQTLNLSSDVAKYLRQMCNFRKLPGDKRKEKHRAFGWVKLEDVRWLKRSGDQVLHVAFGARAEDMYKDMPIMQADGVIIGHGQGECAHCVVARRRAGVRDAPRAGLLSMACLPRRPCRQRLAVCALSLSIYLSIYLSLSLSLCVSRHVRGVSRWVKVCVMVRTLLTNSALQYPNSVKEFDC